MRYILVTMVIVLYFNRQVEGNSNRIKFTETVKSEYFADKTLLIKDFLNDDDPDDPQLKEITAPALTGKTTIIDMVKTFVKINVDNNGNVIPANVTDNYKLFCRAPLNVCRNITFVEKHLGQHPVIHITYKRLSGVIDYESLLFEIRETLSETFLEHSYLENVEDLWPRLDGITKEEFNSYIHSGKKLDREVISRGFYLLSYVLYKHFDRKVIVLVDEYDAYARKILFKKVEDESKILDFCLGLNHRLLKPNNPHLYKAFITGVLRIAEASVLAHDYIFRGNHQFSKYYGYTSKEIDNILVKKISNKHEIEEKRKDIESFYGGFTIQNQDESVFNFWSVSKFFNSRMILKPYWAFTRYIKYLHALICEHDIFEILLQLVKRKTYDLYIEERFRKDDILALSKINHNEETYVQLETYWFFLLLYSLGYLTICETENVKVTTLVNLKLTNTDLMIDLTRELKQCYKNDFKYSQNDILELRKAVDNFQPQKVKKENFQFFYKSLYNLFNNSRHYPDTDDELQNIIFVNLLEKFHESRSGILTTYNLNETVLDHGQIDILVINSHKVMIVIETKFLDAELERSDLDGYALACHEVIIVEQHPYVLSNVTHATGRIYIGLAFHKNTGNISIACSSFTESEGDYRNATIILEE